MVPDENLTLDDEYLASIDVDNGDDQVDDPPRAPRPILPDTVTKLIDSGRGEVRSYRALYFALFGLGLFAATPIATIYRSSGNAGGPAWIIGSVVSWAIGSLLILVGGFRMLPAYRYGTATPNEHAANMAIDTAVREDDEIEAQQYLVEALDAIHETQERVVISGRFVIVGVGFVFVAVALALIRWIFVW